MHSFDLIEEYEYPHHRVLTQEMPHEPIMKFYSLYRSCTQANSTPSPHTAPVAARNASVWARLHCVGGGTRPAKYCPKIPAFRGFFILPQRLLPRLDFPVQVNPTQINTKILSYPIRKTQKVGFFPLWSCRDAYNLTPESTTYDCKLPPPGCIIKAPIFRAKAGARA